ncbi:hypothetical protein FHS83_003269 [Rhizomicrobium palustre]|uniref:Zinc/iron-chelating domain-containing protein n=1 Tax=Rhizomicrobium palustre TaxID=189966 RepID=A0A846N3Z1_9PROT|nr:hypothetical protein [Rhizomicrobium palustre]NIK89951.1 hypothetical protein [Rhizomicrobium palustre]
MPDKETFVVNEACGECHACCRALIIDEQELQKLAGTLCANCRGEAGCAVYHTRPKTCRDFHCGWRMLPLPEEWRPDRCQIMLTQEPADPEKGITEAWKFHFFGSLDKIFWRPFILFASSLLAANKPVYISIPGKPGHYARMMAIMPEPDLVEAIRQWNYAAVVGIVAGLIQTCLEAEDEPVAFRTISIQ